MGCLVAAVHGWFDGAFACAMMYVVRGGAWPPLLFACNTFAWQLVTLQAHTLHCLCIQNMRLADTVQINAFSNVGHHSPPSHATRVLHHDHISDCQDHMLMSISFQAFVHFTGMHCLFHERLRFH